MSGLAFGYDRAAFAELRHRVRGMRERAQDVTPAWDALLDWFAEQERRQWAGRGARWRDPWAPLAPSTLAEKHRLGYPLNPLVRTTRLRTSLTQRPFGVEHMTPHAVTAGTRVTYAKFHQTGTRFMPRRILFSPERIRREEVATRTIANWIIHGRAETGTR